MKINTRTPAFHIIKLAKAKEIDLAEIPATLPPEKQFYTAISEDGKDTLEVGLRRVNRFAVYIGDDLGLPKFTVFKF